MTEACDHQTLHFEAMSVISITDIEFSAPSLTLKVMPASADMGDRLQALQVFKRKGVHFVSLTEKIDTNSAVDLPIFSILAAISQSCVR